LFILASKISILLDTPSLRFASCGDGELAN
jgi:hypothetical protein